MIAMRWAVRVCCARVPQRSLSLETLPFSKPLYRSRFLSPPFPLTLRWIFSIKSHGVATKQNEKYGPFGRSRAYFETPEITEANWSAEEPPALAEHPTTNGGGALAPQPAFAWYGTSSMALESGWTVFCCCASAPLLFAGKGKVLLRKIGWLYIDVVIPRGEQVRFLW